MKYLYAFERLDVWQVSRVLIKEVYRLLTQFPGFEMQNLTNQIRRAAVSISLNIAEGTSRNSLKEQSRFSEIAYGSLLEVYCSFLIAKDLGYIDENDLSGIAVRIQELSNKLNALKNSQIKRSSTQHQTNKQINN